MNETNISGNDPENIKRDLIRNIGDAKQSLDSLQLWASGVVIDYGDFYPEYESIRRAFNSFDKYLKNNSV